MPVPANSGAGTNVLAELLHPNVATVGKIDPAALGSFVGGVVRAYVTEKGIAGITVAMVDRDHPLSLRGYGTASLHSPRKVDPASTLFRLGSISKTFT